MAQSHVTPMHAVSSSYAASCHMFLSVSSCVQDASWKLQASFLPEGWKCLVQLCPDPPFFFAGTKLVAKCHQHRILTYSLHGLAQQALGVKTASSMITTKES
jgi:hypothetical protein